MYSIHRLRKSHRHSKTKAMNTMMVESGKQNLKTGKLKGNLPETRIENGVPIHQESMYQAFLSDKDNTDF